MIWLLPTYVVAPSPEQLRLPLGMLVIFGSAKLLDEIFERLRLPGIVGQILAGILIGPSVLGWMHPTTFLSRLAELGVMFLLFRVGLEIKSSDLIKAGPRASAVAVSGVIIPFFAGWGLLWLWGESRIESIFVGAALVATSVGITAQVLAAKDLLHERASKIILGAAVIDDILGLLVLAIVSSVAKGSVNVLELALTAVFAIGFTLVVVRWGTAAMGRVLPRLNQQLRAGEAQFNAAVVLMFALSVLSVYAGVAAIIGAFFAGMMLSETVEHRVHDLTQGVTEFLVPFFLAGIGLHFNAGHIPQRTHFSSHIAHRGGGGSLEVHRLRIGIIAAGPADRFESRCGDDSSRRSRHGCGTNRALLGSDRTGHLRCSSVHVNCHHADRATIAQLGLPRSF